MSAIVDVEAGPQIAAPSRANLDQPMDLRFLLGFLAVIAGALFFMAYSIYSDIEVAGGGPKTIVPFLLLGVAMLIALGFEFVNGFHDTANAVATVIYTHALKPQFAVVWSGSFNLLGVLLSSGAVAFGIVSLLPVELILQVGSGAGYAMVFALLISAIIWNLGTWWLGLPASSSHTMVGSIVGVGIANALMRGQDGTAGVDWGKVTEIGYALLLSPLFGFIFAALLLIVMKFLVRAPALYTAPASNAPPPLWIRALLIFTRCFCALSGLRTYQGDSKRRRACIRPSSRFSPGTLRRLSTSERSSTTRRNLRRRKSATGKPSKPIPNTRWHSSISATCLMSSRGWMRQSRPISEHLCSCLSMLTRTTTSPSRTSVSRSRVKP